MEQEILTYCMQKGVLLDKRLLEIFANFENHNLLKNFLEIINFQFNPKILTLSFFVNNKEKILKILLKYKQSDKEELEKLLSKFGISSSYNPLINVEKNSENLESSVILRKIYLNKPKKINVSDFVKNFRSRFVSIKGLLQDRPELENLVSINRIENNSSYSIIGLVFDKKITKNDNILLEIEDLTGRISALVTKNRQEVYEKAKEILLDEVIGLKVSGSREIVFINDIFFPDIKLVEKKKSKKEELVAFSSDIHVGSDKFLERNFLKFINWLNGEVGNAKQREEALKVKYLFITGDSVDGVGVYPGQETQLVIKDVREQYKRLAELLSMIRKDVNIIVCPGQHDAVRVAEPQPIIGDFYGEALHKLENIYLVTNPALIEISDVKFKVLMYHGASIHGIINSIDSLRVNKAHNSPTSVVKYLLKKRHLAPTHSLVTYTPCEGEDSLFIHETPDIFLTGDLHRPEISEYNGVLLIASSCWQSITPFEEKVGNNPDPCKVPIMNLKTREIKMLDFSDSSEMDENEIEDKLKKEEVKLENAN
ncbi:MAG: metallophosphoesterase [Nanoarchaeota archaeon]